MSERAANSPPSGDQPASEHPGGDHPVSDQPASKRVWVVIGDKLGDNAQVRTVAAALPWPVVEKQLTFWPPFRRGKPWFLPLLYHVDRKRSAPLAPPWPDLILTVGRRPAMAALWIKRQSRGASRIVLFGPPKGFARQFDLVVVPAQYRAADGPSLLRLDLPLIPLNHRSVHAAGAQWQGRLAALPRPLTAVLVGGATQPFVFDAEVAARLVADVVKATGGAGTLYFTTSRRTRGDAADALQRALPQNARLYRWTAGVSDANPYLGLLACADRFVVTGDSVSMLVEVARLGRPLAIYPLPEQRRGVFAAFRAGGRGERLRDLSEIHQVLFASGRAVPLGKPFAPARPPDEHLPGLDEVVARLCTLVGEPSQGR